MKNDLILYTYCDKITKNILDYIKSLVLKVKRPVSIKRPVHNFSEKSLLNVPYNLRNYFLKPLMSGTCNRNFRVNGKQI